MKKELKLISAIVVSVALLPSCTLNLQANYSPSTTCQVQFNLKNQPPNNNWVIFDGVRIEVDPSVTIESNTPSPRNPKIAINLGSKEQLREKSICSEIIKINGSSLEIVNGDLKIRDRSYGQVKPGEQVFINSQGVQVNGQLRGSLEP